MAKKEKDICPFTGARIATVRDDPNGNKIVETEIFSAPVVLSRTMYEDLPGFRSSERLDLRRWLADMMDEGFDLPVLTPGIEEQHKHIPAPTIDQGASRLLAWMARSRRSRQNPFLEFDFTKDTIGASHPACLVTEMESRHGLLRPLKRLQEGGYVDFVDSEKQPTEVPGLVVRLTSAGLEQGGQATLDMTGVPPTVGTAPEDGAFNQLGAADLDNKEVLVTDYEEISGADQAPEISSSEEGLEPDEVIDREPDETRFARVEIPVVTGQETINTPQGRLRLYVRPVTPTQVADAVARNHQSIATSLQLLIDALDRLLVPTNQFVIEDVELLRDIRQRAEEFRAAVNGALGGGAGQAAEVGRKAHWLVALVVGAFIGGYADEAGVHAWKATLGLVGATTTSAAEQSGIEINPDVLDALVECSKRGGNQ